jgi:hypothetical protein
MSGMREVNDVNGLDDLICQYWPIDGIGDIRILYL